VDHILEWIIFVRKTSHASTQATPDEPNPNEIASKPVYSAGPDDGPLRALVRARAALEQDSAQTLEQKSPLEQLNARFDVALNNMGRGLSMFDSEAKLIVCNKLYREIYDLPDELTRPGTHLADIVRFLVK
jgi:PAS domain-containing protein